MQFQDIRRGMRGQGDVLMGKNTMMKCAIRQMISEKPELEKLVNLVQGNVGFVLTNGDMKEIRDLVMSFKVPAAARSGAIAPVPVVVPAQNTGLGPEKTSFFQAPSILDITEDDIRAKFMAGVTNVAAVSLAIGYPTVASVPHSIANGFKNLMAVAAATEIEFPQVEQLKAYLADPSAFAAAAAPAAAVEEKKEEAAAAAESSEESDEDFGMDLFG